MPETLVIASSMQCQHGLGQELEPGGGVRRDMTKWVAGRVPALAVPVGASAGPHLIPSKEKAVGPPGRTRSNLQYSLTGTGVQSPMGVTGVTSRSSPEILPLALTWKHSLESLRTGEAQDGQTRRSG